VLYGARSTGNFVFELLREDCSGDKIKTLDESNVVENQ